MLLNPTENGGLKSAEAEVERVALHLGMRELHGIASTERSQSVDDGAAGVTEPKQFGHFVEGLACRVVASFPQQAVPESFLYGEQVGVAAAHHKRHGGKSKRTQHIHNDGMNVPFDMVYADKRQAFCETKRFRVGYSDQERTDQTRTFGHGDCADSVEGDTGALERFSNHRHDRAEMLAGSEFRDHAAVFCVGLELRRHHRTENTAPIFHHGRSGLIARRLDAENFHIFILRLRWKLDLSAFDYDLPESSIAQRPLPDRSGSRMLVLDRVTQTWDDRMFRELPSFLRPGDCLVLNNSRVFPSRLFGQRTGAGSGGVEVLLIRPMHGDTRTWQALVRPGRKLRTGERIQFEGGLEAEIIARGEFGERTLRFDGARDIYEVLSEVGHVPLPPYIQRGDTPEDRERYQTVFARETGSVAAPTAGLHFTREVLDGVLRVGAEIVYVTLHVGLGTFQPVRGERLHSEHFEVPEESAALIREAKRAVCVGTTSVRTVESMMLGKSGETDLFIQPGFEFQRTGAVVTNFHLPQSSLLMLVSAFGGREFVLAAYQHAVEHGYRFYSYGDCMLIL